MVSAVDKWAPAWHLLICRCVNFLCQQKVEIKIEFCNFWFKNLWFGTFTMNVDNRKAVGSNGSGQAAAKSSKALLKCPSPPRPGQETQVLLVCWSVSHAIFQFYATAWRFQELTFRQKLEEVKRLRSSGLPTNAGAPRQTTSKSGPAPLPAPVPAKPKVLINGKEALAMHGDWALMESSSGRKYFFNVKTMVNQWTR